jgi:flagellar biosynthetic protein FliR
MTTGGITLDEAQIGAVIVTLVRAAALAFTAPVIGDGGVPARARLIFVVAIAIAVGPNREGLPLADVPATAIVELASGLISGLSARFIMTRIANAGQLMGLSLGLGFASEYDTHAGESAQTLRMIATSIASIAFISTGGLEAIARAACEKPAHNSDLMLVGSDLLRHGTSAFAYGFALAGPVVLAAFVANLGLAVMNRAAPAINVFSISLPVVLMIGGAVMWVGSAGFLNGILATARDAIDVLHF